MDTMNRLIGLGIALSLLAGATSHAAGPPAATSPPPPGPKAAATPSPKAPADAAAAPKGGAPPSEAPASEAPAKAGVVIAVTLPDASPYTLLAENGVAPHKALAPPQSVNGPKAALELLAAARATGKLTVSALEVKRQVLARRTVDASAGSASVTFAAADFDRAATYPVRITSAGKAVSTALVTLVGPDGATVAEETLLPGAGGLVTFRGVPAGKDTVRVVYNDRQTATQDVIVDLATPPDQRQAEVTVVGAKATEPLKAALPDAKSTEPSASPKPDATPAPPSDGGIFGFLVALGILAALGYAGYAYHKQHPEALQSLLGKLPIPAEDDTPPLRPVEPPPVAVPEGTCAFCGQAKDPVTGACACAVPSGAAVPGGSGAPAFGAGGVALPGSGPRLVGMSDAVSGQVFPLNDAALTVGRDASNDVALPGDTLASRRHARVEPGAAGARVQDTGSSNGTFVNGTRVAEAALHPGDELLIGQTRFIYQE